MTRRPNTEQRKRQIAAGLAEVMAKKGYDGASIADIAEAAKVAPGVVHYHFASKLEILLAVLDNLWDAHEARLDNLKLPPEADPLDELDAFIEAHLATGKGADPNALACWIILSSEALREPKVRQRYAGMLLEMRDRAQAIISRGVRAKLFTRVDVEAAAAAIIAAIEGYYVVAAVDRALIPPGSAAMAVKKMIRGLLIKARLKVALT